MTREEAIKILKGTIKKTNTKDGYLGQAVTMAICSLEAQQWIPLKGEWVDSKDGTYYANCSVCNYQMDVHAERGYHNYCPHCGAKMVYV